MEVVFMLSWRTSECLCGFEDTPTLSQHGWRVSLESGFEQ